MPMTSVRAIRGATQASANTAQAVDVATKELLLEIMKENDLSPEAVISVIFTVSPDLNAAFPASSAREVGFGDSPKWRIRLDKDHRFRPYRYLNRFSSCQ